VLPAADHANANGAVLMVVLAGTCTNSTLSGPRRPPSQHRTVVTVPCDQKEHAMVTDQTVAIPPSHDALAEAARQIATAYPDLYAHQRAGIAFLLARSRAILADDMGLGKTRQAIIAVREAVKDGPYLVICPSSVKLNWRREIRLVEPDADVQIIDGGAELDPTRRWTVINYDLLGRFDAPLQSAPWGGVIIDEAHYIKNESKRTTRVLRLLGAGKGQVDEHEPEVVYLLTGTPMASRPRDLFKLLQAVRHPLGTSFFTYTKRYCAAYDNGFGLDTNGASNLEELAQTVSGVLLRRTKDEALDLPPKLRTWQPVSISSRTVGSLEARALDYLDSTRPARVRPGPRSSASSIVRGTPPPSPKCRPPSRPSRSAWTRARRWSCSPRTPPW